MLNSASIKAVDESNFTKDFRKPLLDSYCSVNIPGTIKHFFDLESDSILPASTYKNLKGKYDKVIVVFVDAFGWRFFDKYNKQLPFLNRFAEHGVVSKLTTQFPSTTPAHVTTMNTSLPVGQHGIYEWNHYEASIDELISPLLFSFAGKRIPGSLTAAGYDPEKLFPFQTFHEQLRLGSVNSYISQYYEELMSPYNSALSKGATKLPYETTTEGLINLSEAILSEKSKGYFYYYFGKIDRMGHLYGPDSEQFDAEVKSFFYSLEKYFYNRISGKTNNTLVILTADHGQTEINPKETIYLNKEFPNIIDWIKQNKKGKYLVPAGSCRDVFLHIKEDNLFEAKDYLTEKLSGKAEVFLVQDLIEKGFFGKSLSKKFLGNVGNLVIICKGNTSVWWYEKDKFEILYKGHHGGLTPNEIETVFACLEI